MVAYLCRHGNDTFSAQGRPRGDIHSGMGEGREVPVQEGAVRGGASALQLVDPLRGRILGITGWHGIT